MKSQLMNISQPEIKKTDSFTARNNNTPHFRPQFEPRQYNRPNSRSQNYYNQNSRPQMQSFPRPQIRENQNTYQPSDRCGFCGMNQQTRNVCPARDKICHYCRRQGHFSRVCQKASEHNRESRSPLWCTEVDISELENQPFTTFRVIVKI